MCLIVLKKGVEALFTEHQFRKMITANEDGLGIMYRENGRVLVEKSVGGDKAKFKLWRKHKDRKYYAMHSRLRTHGEINLDNCHPYEVLNIDKGDSIDLYMMHNGVIRNAPELDKKMSDTWNFIEAVIKPIAKANVDLLWENSAIQEMITSFIGGSKLLFMRSDKEPHVLTFNEKAGDLITGCWLSNLHSTGDTKHSYISNTHTYQSNFNATKEEYIPWWNKETINPNVITNKTHEQKSELENEWDEGAYGDYCGGYSLQNKKSNIDVTATPLAIINKTVVTSSKLPKAREDHLLTMLQCYKSMTDYDMIKTMQEDPQEVASIIQHFYTKTTLPDSAIIDEIMNDDTVKNTVALLRNLSTKERNYAA